MLLYLSPPLSDPHWISNALFYFLDIIVLSPLIKSGTLKTLWKLGHVPTTTCNYSDIFFTISSLEECIFSQSFEALWFMAQTHLVKILLVSYFHCSFHELQNEIKNFFLRNCISCYFMLIVIFRCGQVRMNFFKLYFLIYSYKLTKISDKLMLFHDLIYV